MPTGSAALLALPGFHGRGARPHIGEWSAAIETARTMPDAELPPTTRRHVGPPPPRAWADKDPVAAARLVHAREALRELSDRVAVPVENLLTPDTVRRLMWQPPSAADIPAALGEMGARPWQVELTAPILRAAIEAARDGGPGTVPPTDELD